MFPGSLILSTWELHWLHKLSGWSALSASTAVFTKRNPAEINPEQASTHRSELTQHGFISQDKIFEWEQWAGRWQVRSLISSWLYKFTWKIKTAESVTSDKGRDSKQPSDVGVFLFKDHYCKVLQDTSTDARRHSYVIETEYFEKSFKNPDIKPMMCKLLGFSTQLL